MTCFPLITLQSDRVYKDCFAFIGMRQSGKTNFLLWLLSQNHAKYTVFDTIGSIKKAMQTGWRPLHPQTQRIVTPNGWGDILPCFTKTAREIWAQGNTQFIIDDISVRREINGKLKPYLCDKFWMHADLAKIMNQGGNRNISLWLTSQRVAQVHNDLLSNCHHHFIFKLYLPQDIDWYSNVVPRTLVEQSKHLPDFECIYYRLGQTPQVLKPVKKMS